MAYHTAAQLLVVLFLFATMSSGGASLDPRILSITQADGTVWENPAAHETVNNAACADTYSRLNEICETLCSKKAVADIRQARASHVFFRDHYSPKLYSSTSAFAGLNETELFYKAQAWENRWIAVYDKQLAGCKLCESR